MIKRFEIRRRTVTPLFVVHADYVKSMSDGQVHWIECRQLADLYGVHRVESFSVDWRQDRTFGDVTGLNPLVWEAMHHLRPQRSGMYEPVTDELRWEISDRLEPIFAEVYGLIR